MQAAAVETSSGKSPSRVTGAGAPWGAGAQAPRSHQPHSGRRPCLLRVRPGKHTCQNPMLGFPTKDKRVPCCPHPPRRPLPLLWNFRLSTGNDFQWTHLAKVLGEERRTSPNAFLCLESFVGGVEAGLSSYLRDACVCGGGGGRQTGYSLTASLQFRFLSWPLGRAWWPRPRPAPTVTSGRSGSTWSHTPLASPGATGAPHTAGGRAPSESSLSHLPGPF